MNNMDDEDAHHCRCFSITKENFSKFEKKISESGFVKPLFEEDHGHILGLTKRLDEYSQIHVKLMSNGVIESEIEYPPDYPFAHLNNEHSYSAHDEIQSILNSLGITYTFRTIPPTTCIRRKIVKAFKPTHVKTILAGLVVGVIVGGILYYLSKDEE